jgi:D-glucuronyl C5-epimerase C-terminus
VRRRLFGLLLVLLFPSTAGAAPVVVLTHAGHAVHRNDPYLTMPAVTPAPVAPAVAAATKPKPKPKAKERTVRSELVRLRNSGAVTQTQYRLYNGGFSAALASEKRLRGTRRTELEAVVQNLHNIAALGGLTPSRLPALFETLDRNRQWWTTGPLLASGQRVEFSGSELVWQYYPGQGIELQVLGTFGKADGLYTAGSAAYPQLVDLLAEMIPLAARRGGGLTWEYYFKFDGGIPPWTSAMSQGTGLEALTRGYLATGDASYLQIAEQALPIFSTPPKVGVRERTPLGARYLQYSFAPGTDIINAFLQSLIGLYDYAQASGSTRAGQLFAAGDAQAQAELPRFDTGAWSLYQPGLEDSLSYHELVTGFLDQLCTRTEAPVYCDTAEHFHAYLTTPPTLQLLTGRLNAKKRGTIRFRLSKVSHVGIVLVRGTKTVLATSAGFSYGVHTFAIPVLKRRGAYTVRLAATDLAGNFGRIVGTLQVS